MFTYVSMDGQILGKPAKSMTPVGSKNIAIMYSYCRSYQISKPPASSSSPLTTELYELQLGAWTTQTFII